MSRLARPISVESTTGWPIGIFQTMSGAATCDLNAGSGVLDFGIVGGTSASAPAFAGIMALVNQKQATLANPAPRQGNANYVLYALAKKSGASCTSNAAEAPGCI